MSSGFNKLMFSTFAFPKDVFPEIVKVFGSRFAQDLGSNPALGENGRALVRDVIRDGHWGALATLISSGNPNALDELLNSGAEIPIHVFNAIDETWSLAPADQMRLVSLTLDPWAVHQIVHSHRFAPCARDAAAVVLGRDDLVGTFEDDLVSAGGEKVPGWDEKTSRRVVAVGTSLWSLRVSERSGSLDNTVAFFAVAGFTSLNFLGLSIEEVLGYGETEMSRRSWILALSLSESSGQIALKRVLDTAKRLAFAES